MELITCLVCNKQFGRLVIHLKAHGLNTYQYKELYPGAITTPVSLRIKSMETRKVTYLETYGTENPMALPEVKERVQTAATKGLKRKYGDKRGFQVPEIAEKARKTNLEKHGVEYAMQNAEIAQKCYISSHETILEKYGVSNAMFIPGVVERWQQTLFDTYGVISPIQIEGSLEKREKTWLSKYGVSHPLQLLEIIQARRESCFEKYGVYHPMQLKEVSSRNRDTYINNCITQGKTPFVQVGITSIEQAIINLKIEGLEYTGDRMFWVKTSEGYRFPDFKLKGTNKLIEAFGDYWHKPKQESELIHLYKEKGYECLILWEREIRTDLESIKSKILKFLSSN